MKKYNCPWCEGTGIGESNDCEDEPKCEVCDGDGKVLFNPKETSDKQY